MFLYALIWGCGGNLADSSSAAFDALIRESTADICATIYQCLGIDPESTTVQDRTGRPVPIHLGGKAIAGILA